MHLDIGPILMPLAGSDILDIGSEGISVTSMGSSPFNSILFLLILMLRLFLFGPAVLLNTAILIHAPCG